MVIIIIPEIINSRSCSLKNRTKIKGHQAINKFKLIMKRKATIFQILSD